MVWSSWLARSTYGQIEVWLVRRLLRSPRFHHWVQRVEKKTREIRYGKSFEDMGGTKIDDPTQKKVYEHFVEELKHQFGQGNRKR